MIIQYCDKCSHRVDEADFAAGAVHVDDLRVLCVKCAATHKPATKLSVLHAPTARATGTPSATHVQPAHATAPHSRHASAAIRLQKQSAAPWILGGSAAGLILLGAVLYGFSRTTPAQPRERSSKVVQQTTPSKTPTDPAPLVGDPTATSSRIGTSNSTTPVQPLTPTPEKTPVVSPDKTERPKVADDDMSSIRDRAAARALDEIRTYMQNNPADVWIISDKLNDFVASYRSTPSGPEAAKLLAGLIFPKGGGTGTILREYWLEIPGIQISDLTGNPKYPDQPSGSSMCNRFESPRDWADHYGTRMRGYVHPPTTGAYTFWICGDDNCELWLSTSESAADKVKIADVPGHTGWREWGGPQQQSQPIELTAGKKYYIEALHKEHEGADFVAVGWKLPGGELERPISGAHLSPFVVEKKDQAAPAPKAP